MMFLFLSPLVHVLFSFHFSSPACVYTKHHSFELPFVIPKHWQKQMNKKMVETELRDIKCLNCIEILGVKPHFRKFGIKSSGSRYNDDGMQEPQRRMPHNGNLLRRLDQGSFKEAHGDLLLSVKEARR